MLRKEAALEEKRAHSEPPKRPALYELPTILTAYARAANSGGKPGSGVVTRPSTITAQKYEEVSGAYVRAVHSVLTEVSGARLRVLQRIRHGDALLVEGRIEACITTLTGKPRRLPKYVFETLAPFVVADET